MHRPLAPVSLRLALALALAPALGCGGAEKNEADEPAGGPAKIEAVGVEVQLPAGWNYEEKNGKHWVMRSLLYGAMLEKVDTMPASLEAAKQSWMAGKVIDEGEKDGAFYAVVEVDFSSDGTMLLPYVNVIVPIGDAAVKCSGQLQKGDDPKPLVDVCLSMKAL